MTAPPPARPAQRALRERLDARPNIGEEDPFSRRNAHHERPVESVGATRRGASPELPQFPCSRPARKPADHLLRCRDPFVELPSLIPDPLHRKVRRWTGS